jgi:outer membrane protein
VFRLTVGVTPGNFEELRLSLRKVLLVSVVLLSAGMSPALSETIQGALAKAYKFNSQLNSARAGVRSTDENVAIAKSGYRPIVVARGSTSYSSSRTTTSTSAGKQAPRGGRVEVGSFGIQLNQSLFDGFQTRNNVRSAESNVRASRESLRNTEQNILLDAATAYMDVIRDRQIAALTQQNLAFLNEQVRAARSRFDVGEGTRTDVAQAEAERANAVAVLNDAKARALRSAAVYRQVIGEEPGKLTFPKAASKMLPRSLDGAQAIAAEEHPAITASEHLIDAAGFTVKSVEGQLLPQIDATASVDHQYTGADGSGATGGFFWSHSNQTTASVGAQLTIPLYQGGRVAAQVRQSKEDLGRSRINLDVNRDNVRAGVTSAWTLYNAAREGAQANRTVVEARRLALNGVIEERNVGQRTTLDVLNAQADVIQAQIDLASDEHDIVVNSYAIVSAIGRMNGKSLGLNVSVYKPEEHYEAVKDKWFGLRTPDGR